MLEQGERRADYDQVLKRLLARAHAGLLVVLLPGARWLGERSPELPAPRRQADLVWEVALGRERLLLHVELQTSPDQQIGERLAEYALRLWRRDHLPVYSAVVYLRESSSIRMPPFVMERGGGVEAMRFQYAVVRLWEEPPDRVLLTAEAWAWPLAALMAGATAETVATVAERIARAPLSRAEQGELTGLLAALAGLRLPRSIVEQVLRRNPMIRDLLSESSVAEWFREEGLERGLQQGLEGERAIVRTILESRFGQLEAAELEAVLAASEPELRNLAAHIATESRAQIRARLGVA